MNSIIQFTCLHIGLLAFAVKNGLYMYTCKQATNAAIYSYKVIYFSVFSVSCYRVFMDKGTKLYTPMFTVTGSAFDVTIVTRSVSRAVVES